MKTARLTLLLSSTEKAGISRKAAAAGMSASEFVRRAADLLDADDMKTLQEVQALLPEFNAALSRIQENLNAAVEYAAELERSLEEARGPAYRKSVSEEIAADRATLEAGAALFVTGYAEAARTNVRTLGVATDAAQSASPAAAQAGGGGTPFERLPHSARSAAGRVADTKEPWRGDQIADHADD